MGFFTDAYDLFSIYLIPKLLSRIYYFDALSEKPGTLPPRIAVVVNGVAFCETLAGQVFFGWLGDKLGRKRVYRLTLMLMVICSIASGLSFVKSLDGIFADMEIMWQTFKKTVGKKAVRVPAYTLHAFPRGERLHHTTGPASLVPPPTPPATWVARTARKDWE
ncbi:hypothetical protein GOBAR_DD17838 [Gossypium barbadense]|nr:hypothetical protein GOBAR_DD17838 [Gossypium barbadense]